jgi:hypothetical protein
MRELGNEVGVLFELEVEVLEMSVESDLAVVVIEEAVEEVLSGLGLKIFEVVG